MAAPQLPRPGLQARRAALARVAAHAHVVAEARLGRVARREVPARRAVLAAGRAVLGRDVQPGQVEPPVIRLGDRLDAVQRALRLAVVARRADRARQAELVEARDHGAVLGRRVAVCVLQQRTSLTFVEIYQHITRRIQIVNLGCIERRQLAHHGRRFDGAMCAILRSPNVKPGVLARQRFG